MKIANKGIQGLDVNSIRKKLNDILVKVLYAMSLKIYLTTLNLKFFYMQEYFSHEILMLTFYMAQFEVKYDFNSVYYNQEVH